MCTTCFLGCSSSAQASLGPWEQLLSSHHLGALALCLLPVLLSSPSFLPDSELMLAVPLTQDLSVEILPGKKQYSHFPSCPAVGARKRGSSPFYCPTTPSKRYTPRKDCLVLGNNKSLTEKTRNFLLHDRKKNKNPYFFFSFKITHSVRNTAWCPLLLPSASNLCVLL